jgi:hypothetical protein
MTSIGQGGGNSLTKVSFLTAWFNTLAGSGASTPWDIESFLDFMKSDQLCLAFTPRGGMDLPCYFQWNGGSIVINTVNPTTVVTSYLMTVQVEATVTINGSSTTVYYQVDPEMVVGPDEQPPGDEVSTEDRAPGQPLATAATSR